MIELLIVTTILSLFILAAITAWMTHLKKANDARRKVDLNKIRLVLEDYYNDNRRYPDALDCGQDFSPYLKSVPCDPETGRRYKYMRADNLSYYMIYTILSNTLDPAIAQSGCANGCSNKCAYNYGVSSSNTKLESCASGDLIWNCQGSTCNESTGGACPGPGCYGDGCCASSECRDPGKCNDL